MKTELDGMFSNLDHVSCSIGKSNPFILSKECGSQWVKGLLQENKDFSSNPQKLHKPGHGSVCL